MTAWYNEIDPHAAQWLRNLIRDGLIAPGIVDERPIQHVAPSELEGYDQCHFFAGIGGWSAALRSAGWPDHRKVWTGSCPCQPFSLAGKRSGFADDRHLWPHWFNLIQARRPSIIFGEQVASAKEWLWRVKCDLENASLSANARETLYRMRTSKMFDGLPYLSRAWCWRAASALQELPAEVREEVASRLTSVSEAAARKTPRQGQALSPGMDIKKPSKIPSVGMPQTLHATKYAVRPAFVASPTGSAASSKSLRSDGSRIGWLRASASDDAFVGPHFASAWLCVQQYPDCLFSRELYDEFMGRGSGETDHQGVGGEVNGQRRFAGLPGASASTKPSGIDVMRGDLEAVDYAVGAIPVEAASAGADHLRDRYWFVAHSEQSGQGRRRVQRSGASASAIAERAPDQSAGSGHNGVALGDAHEPRSQGRRGAGECSGERPSGTTSLEHAASIGWREGWTEHGVRSGRDPAAPPGDRGDGMANRDVDGARDGELQRSRQFGGTGSVEETRDGGDVSNTAESRWRARQQGHDAARIELDAVGRGARYEWVIGADGKARRVEPGIRLLAHAVSGRVAVRRTVRWADPEAQEIVAEQQEHWYSRIRALKGFGNALDLGCATTFVQSVMDVLSEH